MSVHQTWQNAFRSYSLSHRYMQKYLLVIQLMSLFICSNIPIFSLDPPASRLIFSPGNNSSCSVHSVSSPDSKLLRDLQFNFYRFIFQISCFISEAKYLLFKQKKKKGRMVSKPPGFNKVFISEKKNTLFLAAKFLY